MRLQPIRAFSLAAAAVGTAITAFPASAETPYAGVGIGISQLQDQDRTWTTPLFTLNYGAELTDSLAIEVQYGGAISADSNVGGWYQRRNCPAGCQQYFDNEFVETEITSILAVYTVATLPITTNLESSFRAGLSRTEIEYRVASRPDVEPWFEENRVGTGLGLGAELTYQLADTQLGLSVTRYATKGQSDLHSASLFLNWFY